MNIPHFAEVLLLLSLALIAIEFTDWFPKLAKAMIRFLTGYLPANKSETRRKEWLALLDDIPENYAKLLYSFSFIPATFLINKMTLSRITPNGFFPLAKDLFSISIECCKIIYFSLAMIAFPITIIMLITYLTAYTYTSLFPLICSLLFLSLPIYSLLKKNIVFFNYNLILLQMLLISPQHLNLAICLISIIEIANFNTPRESINVCIV